MIINNRHSNSSSQSFIAKTCTIGFCGGVFFSAISYIMYSLNFTKVNPNIIIKLLFREGKWQKAWQGISLTIIMCGLLSILIALIYYGLLKKINSVWPGALYGVGMFLIIFVLLKKYLPIIKTLKFSFSNSLVSSFCLLLLYGIFIGYSISYEYSERTRLKNNS